MIWKKLEPRKREIARLLRKRMTPAEKLLWGELRRKNVQGIRFRRQQVLSGYIVDFYCYKANLVVEVDGPIHARQYEKDLHRQAEITAKNGCSFLRFSNDEIIFNLEATLKTVQDFIRKSGATAKSG